MTHQDYIEKLIIDVYQTSAQSIERLPGGMSNDTYLVDLGDKKKVVRIPGFSDNVFGTGRTSLPIVSEMGSSFETDEKSGLAL